jgi:hypothetical protein
MPSKPLPPIPTSRKPGRQSDYVDVENHQDQNRSTLLSRAGANLKWGKRKSRKSDDAKQRLIEGNENRKTRTHNGNESRNTTAPDREEFRDTTALQEEEIREAMTNSGAEIREPRTINGEENDVMKTPDGDEFNDVQTFDGMTKVPYDPESTEWKKEYEKTASELKQLRDEHFDHQQGIRERAHALEREFEDPLHSSLSAEYDFYSTIKTLLDNYEARIKEKDRLNRRYQSEHKRCMDTDDALKAEQGRFRMQWANNESTLRAQFDQERASAYHEGAAKERSTWTESWKEFQENFARQSLHLGEEQAKRSALETKVELLETKNATVQSEISDAVHRVTQEHNQTISTLKKNLENADLRLASELSSLEEKHRSQIEVTSSNLKIEHDSKVKMIEGAHEKETEKLEKEHEYELNDMNGKAKALKQEIINLKAEIKSLSEAHAEELRSKEAKYSNELSKEQDKIIGLKKRHALELETKGRAHIGEISKLEARIVALGEKHAIELETKSTTCATELTARDQIHAEEEMKMKGRIESLKTDHSAVLKSRDDAHSAATSKLKKQFRDHLTQREKEHADITKALRVTIGEYSGALLERDKITYNMFEGKSFEPLLDAEVEARFVGLAEEVDTLSRLDWKVNPSGWPEPVLLRLSRNQKTLKRQILKDTIWVILHDLVFCSPFRVFGDEGRALESKWNEECGAGKQEVFSNVHLVRSLSFVDETLNNGSYIWPKPSMKTERWRYITIRECRAALQKPTPSPYDPLAKPRKDFQASIKTIKEELMTAVGGLVTLNQTNIQDLEKMAMRAARTWLEFGLQRYRVMVQMQGDNIRSVRKKVERLDDGLALVVAPKLERFGNAKGEDLDEKERIGELEGETVTLKL